MSCAALSGSIPSTSRSVETDRRSPIAWTATWCTASPRLRAISITRSRTVSSSSARGSVVMVTSASGMSARMARRQPVLDGSDAFERQRAADADAELDEQHRSGRPRANPLDGDDAGHAPRDRRHPFAHAGRRRVGQRVDGAPTEPPAGNADKDRDHERRRGVGPGIAERDADQSDQDGDRRPHVGAEMQRVGFERLTRCFLGDASERAGTKEIDDDRDGDDDEGGRRRLDR